MSSREKAVLVVEDNPDNRYLTTLLLQSEGFEVIGAADAAEALEAVAQRNFDFVLLDLQLPEVDGFEVARRIRRSRSAVELPIIAVSAFAMASDRRKALAAGCTGYIEKPIEAETFVAQARCLAGVMPSP